jgi:hypothetical protein
MSSHPVVVEIEPPGGGAVAVEVAVVVEIAPPGGGVVEETVVVEIARGGTVEVAVAGVLPTGGGAVEVAVAGELVSLPVTVPAPCVVALGVV